MWDTGRAKNKTTKRRSMNSMNESLSINKLVGRAITIAIDKQRVSGNGIINK